MLPTHVISDTHFGHINIIKYEPMREAWGTTVDEMNETMLRAWETTVSDTDVVLHLGDIAMGSVTKWEAYRKRMTGKLIVVKGNHDKSSRMAILRPDELYTRYAFTHPILGRVVCRHDPAFINQEDLKEADILLHGHLHSGNHHPSTMDAVKVKAVCCSVEALVQPGPMLIAQLTEKLVCISCRHFRYVHISGRCTIKDCGCHSLIQDIVKA